MKRFLMLTLVVLIVFSLAACKEPPKISDEQAQEQVESVLGDVQQLPMDIEKIKESFSENAVVSTEKKEDSNNSTEIIVGDGAVVYHCVSENTAKTQSGQSYTFTIEIMHFGGTKTEGNNYTMKFVGANITMTIEAENTEAVKEELLNQLETVDMPASQKPIMRDLLEGKQVYAEVGGDTWDMYAQVNKEVETTYDQELGTFWQTGEPEYDDMYDQYCYEVKDFSGRVKERHFYKIDANGKKWSIGDDDFTYLADGTVKTHSISYYEFTEQIWSESVYQGQLEEGLQPLWTKTYTEDGALSNELYHNEDGNQVVIEYFSDGSISSKRISTPCPEYPSGLKEIYSEQYNAPGVLWEKTVEDGDYLTREHYYENGKLQERSVVDLTRRFENDEPYTLEYVKGFEDGSKTVFTFHNSGEWKTVAQYDTSELCTSETLYRENGTPEKGIYYYSDGSISMIDEHHENGNLKTRTEYNTDGEAYSVTHFDENGNPIG